MRMLLLVTAAGLAAGAVPATAQDRSAMTRFSPEIGTRSGSSAMVLRIGQGDDRDHGRRDHRHHGRGGDVVVPWGWYGDDWAYYNNRSFSSDSYNDWWHDRPERAFPRWVQNNQSCDRIWWSGSGWHC